MPPTIPTRVPDKIHAGDSVNWNISNSDYPAPTWTLTFTFINERDKFSITSTADGDSHAISVAPAISGKYPAGLYYWKCRASDGTDKYLIQEGRTTVLQNLEDANLKSADLRSHAKKVLDAVEAVIENRASDSDMSMSVDGQSITNFSPEQLTDLRSKYLSIYNKELNAERVAQGRSSRKKSQIRFTDN